MILKALRHIAQCYKERWGIELFFKWVKPHLKIKKFLGRSYNAVPTQIFAALMTSLLTILYSQAHRLNDTLWENFGLISDNLFNPTVTGESLPRTLPRGPPRPN